jgi:hypothetical protein
MNAATCFDLLSKLHEFVCSPDLAPEMLVAKELFSIETGKVNDDDPFYENRMQAFQEYFLFDFRLSDVLPGATALEYFLSVQSRNLKVRSLLDYEFLRSSRHSLFFIEKTWSDKVQVKDYFSGQRWVVQNLPNYSFVGFEPGLVFEGRMIFFHGQCYFTGVFLFHPKEVRPAIEKMVKQVFAQKRPSLTAQETNWKGELQRRSDVLMQMSKQHHLLSHQEKLRGIDVLKISKMVAHISQSFSQAPLVMSIGNLDQTSLFVPESPFWNIESFLHKLSLLYIKCFRYRHIDPVKIYGAPSASVPPQVSRTSESQSTLPSNLKDTGVSGPKPPPYATAS